MIKQSKLSHISTFHQLNFICMHKLQTQTFGTDVVPQLGLK
jgi:hypothetical protein